MTNKYLGINEHPTETDEPGQTTTTPDKKVMVSVQSQGPGDQPIEPPTTPDNQLKAQGPTEAQAPLPVSSADPLMRFIGEVSHPKGTRDAKLSPREPEALRGARRRGDQGSASAPTTDEPGQTTTTPDNQKKARAGARGLVKRALQLAGTGLALGGVLAICRTWVLRAR